MRHYCTFLLCGLLFFGLSGKGFAQENHGNTLNAFVGFGNHPSISANYEFSVHPDITVSPEARIWFSGDNNLAVGARGDYYFDRIFNLAEPWDIWGGLDAGFIISGNDDKDSLNLNLHIGGEYKFDDMWGIILEIGGGTSVAGGLGVGIHF
jgi:hypothetical protein